MKKVAVILANGFEEVEALAPIDYLRRAGVEVDVIGLDTQMPVGTHGITVAADITNKRADINAYDAVILPGGMPGATNLDNSEFVSEILKATYYKEGIIAAICAAPLVLGHRGYLCGKRATCYPGFEKELNGAKIVREPVVTDGKIVTAIGMGAALAFGKELTSLLCGEDVAEKISNQIQSNVQPTKKDDSFDKLVASLDLTVKDLKDRYAEDEEKEEDAIPERDCVRASDYENYKLPDASILNDAFSDTDCDEEIQAYSQALIETFDSFNIKIVIREVTHSARFIKLFVVPAKGIRVSQIEKLADDITLALGVQSVRIEAPIPGKSSIGIEIPRRTPRCINIKELIDSDEFKENESKTAVCIGKNTNDEAIVADISKMPHLLIAGAVGMGKSVLIHSLIASILYKATPDEVKFIMIDPKQVEFTPYNGLPHLLVPTITDPEMAAGALMWAIDETNRRYDAIEKLGVRNIDAYNEKVKENPELGKALPKIVIIIDELNDLMIQVRDPIENFIMLIAQKSRAAGIHLVVGTQRPAVNVITGIIKANIPSRIACKVSSGIDSRTILEQTGAEKLIGKGDMLVHLVASAYPIRVQGAFISDEEIMKIVEFAKAQASENPYDAVIIEDIANLAKKVTKKPLRDDDEEESRGGFLNDNKFLRAVEIAIKNGSVSTSLIQRKLAIGYGKAAHFIDAMEDLGIIAERDGAKARAVLVTQEEWEERLKRASSEVFYE